MDICSAAAGRRRLHNITSPFWRTGNEPSHSGWPVFDVSGGTRTISCRCPVDICSAAAGRRRLLSVTSPFWRTDSDKLEFGVAEPTHPLAPPLGELAAPKGAHLRGPMWRFSAAIILLRYPLSQPVRLTALPKGEPRSAAVSARQSTISPLGGFTRRERGTFSQTYKYGRENSLLSGGFF